MNLRCQIGEFEFSIKDSENTFFNFEMLRKFEPFYKLQSMMVIKYCHIKIKSYKDVTCTL